MVKTIYPYLKKKCLKVFFRVVLRQFYGIITLASIGILPNTNICFIKAFVMFYEIKEFKFNKFSKL